MIRYIELTAALEAAARRTGEDDTLAALLAQYEDAIREVATRLRRCDTYLRRGLRSEAIHLADCAPTLAHVIDGLAPRDAASLQTALAARHVPQLPDWQIAANATLAALGVAKATEESLRPLLARHRALALTAAPAEERIQTLQTLAAADAANPTWTTELRKFDAEYLFVLRTRCTAAVAHRDRAAIYALIAELQPANGTAGSLSQSLIDLLNTLTTARTALDESAANEALGTAADAVAQAHAANDIDAAKAALRLWQSAVQAFGHAVPPRYTARIAAAMTWIDTAARDRRHAEMQANINSDLHTGRRWKWLGR